MLSLFYCTNIYICMHEYGNFIRRADLIKNLIEREKLVNEQAKKPNRKIQEANQRRWLQYQELLRAELTAKIAAANSSGGPTTTTSIDADAQAFITAAAITNPTQQTAINTLVVSMKGYGIWTKMKAIYPFVGGTEEQHKFNLKNPLNTSEAFRLIFFNGGTQSATGYTPNGINQWANSFLTPSTTLQLNSAHMSAYVRTDTTSGGIFGCYNAGVTNGLYTNPKFSTGIQESRNNSGDGGNVVNTDSRGFWINTRINSTQYKIFKNNTINQTSNTNTTGLCTVNAYVGAININGTTEYQNREIAFASIGDGLTDTEAANYYTAVQTFQTSLNRQVGVPIVADADAQAFLNAAVIEDVTQANAVNTLVTSLKGYGIWTKMKALYPFVGGTASSHKWNLKNPLDTDAAYRLTFNGGITHSANGIQGNAINGYYQTFINPSVVFSPASGGSQFIYSRTDLDTGVDLGALAFQPSLSRFYFISRLGANQTEFACLSGGVSTPTNVNSQGFFGITREPNAPNYYCVLNTNSVSTTDAYQEPNSTITGLGLIADTGQSLSWSARQQAMACIADGLTVAEAQNLRLANLTFQTTLSRNV